MYHTKNDKRSIQSCDRLFDALNELSHDKAFEDISIKEIITKAEVARATFYRNFDHKEDILVYKVDKCFIELHDYLYNYYANGENLALIQTHFIVPFLNFWLIDPSLIKLLIRFKKISILRDAFQNLLYEEIQNHYDQPINYEEFGYFVAMRSGIAINVLVHWIKTGMKDTPIQISKMLTEQMGSVMNNNLFGKEIDITELVSSHLKEKNITRLMNP